jgi:chromosome segregation ATPase
MGVARKDMEAILLGYERFLTESTPTDSYYEAALQDHDAQEGQGPVSVQIAEVIEELQQLKFLFIEVATKEMFLKKLSDTRSLPSLPMQELVAAEMEAGQEKAELKKSKSARAEAMESLDSACRALSTSVQENMRCREEFGNAVGRGLAELRLQNVMRTLENRSIESLESLASEAGSLDAKSCEHILSQTCDELHEAKRDKAEFDAEMQDLRQRADALRNDQVKLESEVSDLNNLLEKTEKEDEEARQLRIESTRHRALYSALSSLTRTRISCMEEGRLCLEITISRAAGNLTTTIEKLDMIYVLDMALMDQPGSFVSSIILTPPDVDVSSLLYTEYPMTVQQATHEVIDLLLGVSGPTVNGTA